MRRILIADDAPMFRDLGALFLARSGEVLTARNGNEALHAARRHRPHVVVADLEMPELAGDELCRRIKTDPELGDTPVILMAAADLPEHRARAVRAGADDVVAKPVSRVSLIQAVNRFLRGPGIRGLARVPLETQVRIRRRDDEAVGRARNLSRGGIFVEADVALSPATELSLQFALPETRAVIEPTAQVVWRRDASDEEAPGMGLRFLALDGDSARQIDEYVYERAEHRDLAAPGEVRR
jgi:uncharacterized protein (TIGR02266 family)